jgi:hypothetical protein
MEMTPTQTELARLDGTRFRARRRPSAASGKSAPQIVLEFPNFGFGPAATALRLVPRLLQHHECLIVSTGSALGLARRTLPEAATCDIDTLAEDAVERLLRRTGPEPFVLSVTNPGFAAAAASAGCRVGVVDTLHWLWDDATPAVEDAEFYVGQHYWGVGGTAVRAGMTLASPDPVGLGTPADPLHGSRRALVTFGGMGLPYDEALPLEFAAWTLEALLPTILAAPCIEGVDIVGGHPGLRAVAARSLRPRVRYVGVLSMPEFVETMRAAPVVIATPGIATIHELQWAQRRTLLLPGSNASQVLQLRDLVDLFDVRSALEWPGVETLAPSLRRIPELDAVTRVARLARDAMAEPGCCDQLVAKLDEVLATGEVLLPLGDSSSELDLEPIGDVVTRLIDERVEWPRRALRAPRIGMRGAGPLVAP